ncbi:hypothetical protein PHET_00163, partial [Paragonimus heterotremus]
HLFINFLHLPFSGGLVRENFATKHSQSQQTGWSMVMEVAVEDPNKSDINKDKKQPISELLPNSVRCGELVCLNGARCHKISAQKNYTEYEQYICLCQIGFSGTHCELANEGYRYPRITEGGYLKFPFSNTRNRSLKWLNEKHSEYKQGTKMPQNTAKFQISFELRPSAMDGRRLIVYHSSEQSGLHFVLTMEDRSMIFRFRENVRQLHSDLISHYQSDALEEIRHPHMFRSDGDWLQVEIGCDVDRKWYIAVNGNKVEVGLYHIHVRLFQWSVRQGSLREQWCLCNYFGVYLRVPMSSRHQWNVLSTNNVYLLTTDQPIYLPQYNGFRSYTEYKGLQHTSRSETTLELTFKPAFPDGLILYQGFRDDRRGDFLAILIRAAQVEVLFDLGSGTAYLKSPTKISLNTWHTARFLLLGRQGVLQMDGTEHVQTTFSEGPLVQLTLSQPLYLGYHPNLDQTSAHLTEHVEHNSISEVTGFKGCIQELRINGLLVNLIGDAIRGSNVENCQSHPCAQPGATCSNRAECWPDNGEFHCACPLGYTGKQCQADTPLEHLKRIRFGRSSFMEYKSANLMNMYGLFLLNTPHFDIYLDLRLSSLICDPTGKPSTEFIRLQTSAVTGSLFKPRECLILSAVTPKSMIEGNYLVVKISEEGLLDLVLDHAADLMGSVSDVQILTKVPHQNTWSEPRISSQTKLHANMWHKIMLKR